MRGSLSGSDNAMTAEAGADGPGLDRRVNRLATERTTLFAKAGSNTGMTQADRQRLKDIERELDDCFAVRREQRAARDARRFSRYDF
jgi:hypothetical protein